MVSMSFHSLKFPYHAELEKLAIPIEHVLCHIQEDSKYPKI